MREYCQYWYDRTPEKIEAFLRDWYDAPELKLVFVLWSIVMCQADTHFRDLILTLIKNNYGRFILFGIRKEIVLDCRIY
jgi:hypothetical protein